jgi:DNA polymerase (family 10)
MGSMENTQIAEILDEIGDLLELTEGDLFRIRSYHSAARAVRDLPRRLEDMLQDGAKLSELPHIGKSTSDQRPVGACGR